MSNVIVDMNTFGKKVLDFIVMAVLLGFLFWVLFPLGVKAAGPEISGWVPWWADDSGIEEVIDNLEDVDIIYPFVYEIEAG